MRNLVQRSLFVAALAAVPLMTYVGSAAAALNSYLKIKPSKGTEIKGGVTMKDELGSLKVLKVSHQIVSPRDAASGQATGKRQHKPLEVTVELDQAWPRVLGALVGNEQIGEVVLTHYAIDQKSGADVKQFEMKLLGASISGYTLNHSDGSGETAGAKHTSKHDVPASVTLSFTYQKIIWTWQNGKVTAEDDWLGQVGQKAPKKPG
jgi:type VI secretion system secreted protein Hcp